MTRSITCAETEIANCILMKVKIIIIRMSWNKLVSTLIITCLKCFKFTKRRRYCKWILIIYKRILVIFSRVTHEILILRTYLCKY